jgi:membrane-bound ClpP family serine protease
MKRLIQIALAMCLVLAVTGTAFASVEIRLKDGSKWRGEVADMVEVTYLEQRIEVSFTGKLLKAADLYIIVEGNVAGHTGQRTIFRGDIVGMRTLGLDSSEAERAKSGKPRPKKAADPAATGAQPKGVFLLPLEGPVGETLRHDEITMLGEHADKFGPGQIIVLKVKSNGGLVYEAELINEAIDEVRERHRVVAWVDKAVSAGCSTAMGCDEIYFQTNGICGSVTTIRGLTAVPEEEVKKGIEHLVELAVKNGRSEHIARAMKLNKYVVSYDKDPETGEVTFYGDLSGEFILSDDTQNLCFNAKDALHCGFSDGTADTTADLAKLLDLDEWNEIDDYGRKIAKKWQRTATQVKEDLARLKLRYSYYKTGSGDPIEILGARIQILEQILRCYKKAELITYMSMGVEPEAIERQIVELRKQLADMKK